MRTYVRKLEYDVLVYVIIIICNYYYSNYLTKSKSCFVSKIALN